MTKIEYFTLEESLNRPGKYIIQLNLDKLSPISTNGSFNILPARLLNLSYAQYLRFCRDVVGGELGGKNHTYPTVYFDKNLTTVAFVKLLNSRMGLVIWEREHPDWREHEDYVKQKEESKYVSNQGDNRKIQ